MEKLLPGDLVMADRGFTIHESLVCKQAELAIPRGKEQLDPVDVEKTRGIANVRIQVVGKRCIEPDCRHPIKCGRTIGISKVTSLGSCPKTRQVADAMANTPQSLEFVCCCTGMLVMLLRFDPSKFSASSCIS